MQHDDPADAENREREQRQAGEVRRADVADVDRTPKGEPVDAAAPGIRECADGQPAGEHSDACSRTSDEHRRRIIAAASHRHHRQPQQQGDECNGRMAEGEQEPGRP